MLKKKSENTEKGKAPPHLTQPYHPCLPQSLSQCPPVVTATSAEGALLDFCNGIHICICTFRKGSQSQKSVISLT